MTQQTWLQWILRISSRIHAKKERLMQANGGEMVGLAMGVVASEILLFFVSLPTYLVLRPAAWKGRNASEKQAVRAYQLRRVISLSVLATMVGIWLIKILFTSSVLLGLLPGTSHAGTESWNFNTSINYVYDPTKIQVVDGMAIFRAERPMVALGAGTEATTTLNVSEEVVTSSAAGVTTSVESSVSEATETTLVPTVVETVTSTIGAATTTVEEVVAPSPTSFEVEAVVTPVTESGVVTNEPLVETQTTVSVPTAEPTPAPTPTPTPTVEPTLAPAPTPAPEPVPAPVPVPTPGGSLLFNSLIPEVHAQNQTCEATIQSVLPLTVVNLAEWTGFRESANKNGGEIYYQLSSDGGLTWYWWTGSLWNMAGLARGNNAHEINAHIQDFPTTGGTLNFKATLVSDCTHDMQLLSVTAEYTQRAMSLGHTLLSHDPSLTFTDETGTLLTSATGTVYVRQLGEPVAELALGGNIDLSNQVVGRALGKTWMSLDASILNRLNSLEVLVPKTRSDASVRVCPNVLSALELIADCPGETLLSSSQLSTGAYALVDLSDPEHWHVAVHATTSQLVLGVAEVIPQACGQILDASSLAPVSLVTRTLPTNNYTLSGAFTFTPTSQDTVVRLRYTDSQNYMALVLGDDEARFMRKLDGILSSVGSAVPFAPTLGATYRFKVQANGDDFSAKWWIATEAEPEIWLLSATDHRFASGNIGLSLGGATVSGLSISSCVEAVVSSTTSATAPVIEGVVSATTTVSTTTAQPVSEVETTPSVDASVSSTISTSTLTTDVSASSSIDVETPVTTTATSVSVSSSVSVPTVPVIDSGVSDTGSSDIVSTTPVASSSAVVIATPLSATVWVYPTSSVITVPFLAQEDKITIGENAAGQVQATIFGEGTSSVTVTSDEALTLEQWHLINLTYDGTTARLYVDGAIQAAQPATLTISSASTTLSLGVDPTRPTVRLAGQVAAGSVVSQVLTPAEIAVQYLTGRNTPPTVILTSAQQQRDDGFVDIRYRIQDLESNITSLVEYEYSLTGAFRGEEHLMTAAGVDRDHEGLVSLASSPSGVAHTFVWNVAADLGSRYDGSVYVRLRATDGVEAGPMGLSSSVTIDAHGPLIIVTGARQLAGSDRVEVTYRVSDETSPITVEAAASLNQGETWTSASNSWDGAIGSVSSSAALKTIMWNAGQDFPEQEVTHTLIALSASDGFGNQSVTSSAFFFLDTSAPFGLANLQGGAANTSTILWSWSPIMREANFDRYEFWYGTDEAAVSAHASGTIHLTERTQPDLGIMGTHQWLTSGLVPNTRYYAELQGFDTYGHATALFRASYATLSAQQVEEILEANAPTRNSQPAAGASAGVGGGGGGGIAFLPASSLAPQKPVGGFSLQIDQGAASTNQAEATLTLRAGNDITSVAISRYPDLHDAVQQPYTPTITWNLCDEQGGLLRGVCGAGKQTLYAKFYTVWGISSPVVSDTIKLTQTQASTQNSSMPRLPGDLSSLSSATSTNELCPKEGEPACRLVSELSRSRASTVLAEPEVISARQTVIGDEIELAGRGIPNSQLILFVHSDQALVYHARVGEDGTWRIRHSQLAAALEPGIHTVYAMTYDEASHVRSHPTKIKKFEVAAPSMMSSIAPYVHLPTTLLTLFVLCILITLFVIRRRSA